MYRRKHGPCFLRASAVRTAAMLHASMSYMLGDSRTSLSSAVLDHRGRLPWDQYSTHAMKSCLVARSLADRVVAHRSCAMALSMREVMHRRPYVCALPCTRTLTLPLTVMECADEAENVVVTVSCTLRHFMRQNCAGRASC